MIDGTLLILKDEKDEIAAYENSVKKFLQKHPDMKGAKIANIMPLTSVAKMVRESLQSLQIAINEIGGSSSIKAVIQGQEVTVRDALITANEICTKLLECIQNEMEKMEKINEEIKTLENVKEELFSDIDKYSKMIEQLETVEKSIHALKPPDLLEENLNNPSKKSY
ncbi:hypothetical protein [Cardinium endosymbiont of Philonthus spinipes]|uniref:hypothetical protein n=1 Tax=Cardinium endosymbiont of Philonthus spinipes TaxID=3077941 RepID=UPI00313BE172